MFLTFGVERMLKIGIHEVMDMEIVNGRSDGRLVILMAVFHDEIEIEDFEYDEETEIYTYPCPCGDQFEITKVVKC